MARVVYRVPQPVQPPDGDPVYTKVRIYRAPNVAGVPGAFSLIATVIGDPERSYFYLYEDDAAASTLDDWYRHDFTNQAVTAFSDFSISIKVDEFLVLLWALADISDADIDKDDVTQWAVQGITDFWPEIWKPLRRPVMLTDNDADNGGGVRERYEFATELFEVWRVEKVNQRDDHTITGATNASPIVVTSTAHGFSNGDTVLVEGVLGNTAANGVWTVANKTANTFELQGSTGNAAYTSAGKARKSGDRHVAWMFAGTEWMQEDRELRLLEPDSLYDYVMHGKQRYRDISELGEEVFQLLYWQIRRNYLDFRVNKRSNTPRFLVLDRKSDTSPEQLQMFLDRAEVQVATRFAKLRMEDPAIDLAPA